MKRQNTLLISMIFSMILWGLSWPSAKVLTVYSNPINLAIYRYLFVFFTLLPILFLFKIPLKVKKSGILFILISAALLAMYSYVMFQGLAHGFAGAGGVLVTTLNPIFAYFFSILIKRQKPAINEIIGLVLGLIAGCVLLKIWGNLDAIFLSGNIYFLASAFIWAIMSRFTAKSSEYGSPFSFSLWMYLVTLVILIPLIDVSDFKQDIQIKEMNFWSNLFFSGAIVTSLATTIFFYATSKLGSDKASSFIFLVPFSAAISSWLLLGEKLEIHTIIGGLLGISAVYMLQKRNNQ